MPNLDRLFDGFPDNEYYGITKKIKHLQEIELIDNKAFVQGILEKTKLFRYECNDKNSELSKKSRELLELISKEGHDIQTPPTLWGRLHCF